MPDEIILEKAPLGYLKRSQNCLPKCDFLIATNGRIPEIKDSRLFPVQKSKKEGTREEKSNEPELVETW